MFASPVYLSLPAHAFEHQYAVVDRGQLALPEVLDAYLLRNAAQANPVAPEVKLAKPVSVLDTCPAYQHNGDISLYSYASTTHTWTAGKRVQQLHTTQNRIQWY